MVLTVFRSPHSYTGEDVAEFSCHGGIAVLKRALEAVLAAGARLAEPGEFTKRAFLNGKIDLAQAEAVNDLIRARTDGARRVALSQLDGALSGRVGAARDRILGVIAAIEAAVDFPDDVDEPDRAWLEAEIGAARESVEALLRSFNTGRVYREGLRVVIAGRVNVGKSSLLNALLRHARAIVTPIPGTTRDVIEESLEIRGIPIVALDTAGLRATDDPIERIGVELAERSLESADLILLVLDVSEGMRGEDAELTERFREKPAIVVLNKIDLLPEGARGLVTKEYVERLGRSLPAVQTCASSGKGIEELEDAIASAALSFDRLRMGSGRPSTGSGRGSTGGRRRLEYPPPAIAPLRAGEPEPGPHNACRTRAYRPTHCRSHGRARLPRPRHRRNRLRRPPRPHLLPVLHREVGCLP